LVTGCGLGGHRNAPKLTLPPSVVTRWVTARATSIRPAPWSKTSAVGVAVLMSTGLSRVAVQSGCCCARIAAAPATCGAAMEVPDAMT
jgi:hypothetical protein